MNSKRPVSRESIIQALVSALEPLDFVYAFWEGGAVSWGRLDQWSDVDLYVDADDKHIKEVSTIIEERLETLAPIALKYEPPAPPGQGYTHAFYRLEGTSRFLLIDVAVIKHSSPEKFLESEIHGKAVFYFNKDNAVKCASLDRQRLEEAMKARLPHIQKRFDMFECFVAKEINRGNWIEALDLYYRLTLDCLVEALRIRHKPAHYDFKTRYIHYDLPGEIVAKLQDLYFIKDSQDLRQKHQRARRWFAETVEQIDLADLASYFL